MKRVSLVLFALMGLTAVTGCDARDVLGVAYNYTSGGSGGSNWQYDYYADLVRPGGSANPYIMRSGITW